jgi:hypothetical protein
LETGGGLWQDIVKLKYVKQYPICMIPNKFKDSPLWKDLLKIRHIYLKGRRYKIGNGKKISFWMDQWLEDNPLYITYPILFYLCLDQASSIHEVASEGWVIKFKCHIQGLITEQWYEFARKVNIVTLSQDNDQAIWK